ncbi:MAG TPA: hypothetical protein VEK07_10075 [Polyangiaceae bacterium]|nr:hypothetical protein [Polyangiaceae bacterium]
MSSFLAALVACAYMALAFVLFGVLPTWLRKHRRGARVAHAHVAGGAQRHQP